MKSHLANEEAIALTRDGFSRDNPDSLINGFFPAWAVVIWLISSNAIKKI